MNLEDIPRIRKQFQSLDQQRVATISQLSPISPLGDREYNQWKRSKEIDKINEEYRNKKRALCKKYFGDELSSYELDIYPGDVLDWIEHFLKEQP